MMQGGSMNRRTIFACVFIMMMNIGLCYAQEKPVMKDSADSQVQWNFDNTQSGKLPAGAQIFTGTWAVRAEHGAPSAPNVLCQNGIADYPAIVLGSRVYSDVTVYTSFKPISGKEDMAAGIIFRVQDKDNYYILRANALEDNVILFKYVKGRRSSIKEGNIKVAKGVWQELRVEAKDSHILGYLNGTLIVDATDSTFKSGKLGLWTKADSQTCFDNFSIVK